MEIRESRNDKLSWIRETLSLKYLKLFWYSGWMVTALSIHVVPYLGLITGLLGLTSKYKLCKTKRNRIRLHIKIYFE